MGRGAPPWSQVRLRVTSGPIPDVGDELRMMTTGRRYQVIGVRGRAMQCLVLPADAAVQGPVWDWQWTPRARKAVL